MRYLWIGRSAPGFGGCRVERPHARACTWIVSTWPLFFASDAQMSEVAQFSHARSGFTARPLGGRILGRPGPADESIPDLRCDRHRCSVVALLRSAARGFSAYGELAASRMRVQADFQAVLGDRPNSEFKLLPTDRRRDEVAGRCCCRRRGFGDDARIALPPIMIEFVGYGNHPQTHRIRRRRLEHDASGEVSGYQPSG